MSQLNLPHVELSSSGVSTAGARCYDNCISAGDESSPLRVPYRLLVRVPWNWLHVDSGMAAPPLRRLRSAAARRRRRCKN